jgi:hypothetical protein
MEMNGQLYAQTALSQGKNPWYPLDRRLGDPQSWSGEEKKSVTLPEFEPPIIQLVAQSYITELSRIQGNE